MAWGEIKVVEQRQLFIEAYLKDKESIAVLCRQYSVSRKTGYKWIRRYEQEGSMGLRDRSRAPLNQRGATDPKLVNRIIKARQKQPTWGPKKIYASLVEKHPAEEWPSTTTMGKIFDRSGLTVRRKYRKRFPVVDEPLAHCQETNYIWCADFKGWNVTSDGHKCGPFTLTDAYSRFILRCVHLNLNDTGHVWAVLEAAFREYGLPLFIRSDNGPTFATNGDGRLSLLSVKLIKIGIIPEFIEPGKPQQNGRHERMHLTLQQEGMFPELTLEEQEMEFLRFLEYFNFERPHEALGQKSPGNIYQPSPRVWNGRLRSPEYSNNYKVGKVRSCGKMNWAKGEVYIGRALEGEPIGVIENEEGKLLAYYGPIYLGVITRDNELEIERRPARKRRVRRG
jgi:transposase InsO family protein